MKIGIYSRSIQETFFPIMGEILSFFNQRSASLHIHSNFASQLRKNGFNIDGVKEFDHYNNLDPELEMMISIGGDGTFLETVTYIRNRNIPILGINSGRLGFLADIAPKDIIEALNDVFDHKYTIENRSLIGMETSEPLNCEFPYALNDFTIRKNDQSTLVKIHTWVNGEFLNTYWADGLIISTPTGSTAYSLSVGGPIVVPETNNLIISPIASHNLTVRPLVVSADHKITFNVESRTDTHIASLDARTFFFEKSMSFSVKKAPFSIRIIKIEGHSYFNTIRNKLMWGIDKRN
ncbi:putative inorganic polyphosphate/ATP-NAD kinase [Salinivirga cyanobacteriivorans]|uniref:NAD kinase n=1 Tax=Salinivirga cyanobacteriivorans TaxID=1307839 RepID=A0A0S2I2J0_9BACT|nr:NAD kinase [Salinivirga cyanobacteriivorans]ALO16566.1 putative inorganic polyphosphate/ATP-NAD kinase [Salinivirga cyanobacteriivorans]